jgi:GDPmannose 4,6-dehydratase
MKKALILGCSGQDGSYLTEILLEKGYEVHGGYRHSSGNNLKRVDHIKDQITLHKVDLLDTSSIYKALQNISPDEVYNEADQDNVGYSFETPHYSVAVTAGGVANLLESARRLCPKAKIFQPCSATMFGDSLAPQNENSKINPLSPYACAKTHAYHLCRYYRQCYGMFVSTAILYNHDSARRSKDYFLQKVCRTAIQINRGKWKEKLQFDNLDALLDIGYARDYMQAAYQILQYDIPTDFVISTGKGVPIHEWLNKVFGMLNMKWSTHIDKETTPFRPGPECKLIGDHSKATRVLGYKVTTPIDKLIAMVLEQAEREETK